MAIDIRPANMGAIEELERAADGLPMQHPPGARTRELMPEVANEPVLMSWADAEVLNNNIRRVDVRLTFLMRLVSVLCVRFNVEAEEIDAAYEALTKAEQAQAE